MESELEEKIKKRRERLETRLAVLENNLEQAIAPILEEFSLKAGVPSSQIPQLSQEIVKAVKAVGLERVLQEPSSFLPKKIETCLTPLNLPREINQGIINQLLEEETITNTASAMEKRIEEAWHYSISLRSEEELKTLLVFSLPEELVEQKEVFNQIAKTVIEKGSAPSKKELAERVKKAVRRHAPEFHLPELAEKIDQVLSASAPPGLLYSPPVPVVTKSAEIKTIQKEVRQALTQALNNAEIKHQPAQIKEASHQLVSLASQEKTVKQILFLEERREQNQAISKILKQALEEQGLILPEEKRGGVLKNVLEKTSTPLLSYLKNQETRINRLKQGLEKIEHSPIGALANLVGLVSSKAKEAVLVGFFRADKKTLNQLKEHYQAKAKKTELKAEFGKELLGQEGEEPNLLKQKAQTLKRTARLIEKMAKVVEKPSPSSKAFITAGGLLQTAGSFLSKKPFQPLNTLDQIKNLDLTSFLPRLPISLPQAVDKLIGLSFYDHLPELFVKNSLGTPVFKLSFPGLRISLRKAFSGVKKFINQKIINSSFFQGIKAFGGKIFSKLSLKGLTSLGARLGIKALGGIVSGGTALLLSAGLEIGKKLFQGAFNFLGGAFGLRKKGLAGEPGVLQKLGGDSGLLMAAGGVAAVVLVFMLSLFSFASKGMNFVAQPYQLQKGKPLGISEEKIASPSATPTLTPGP